MAWRSARAFVHSTFHSFHGPDGGDDDYYSLARTVYQGIRHGSARSAPFSAPCSNCADCALLRSLSPGARAPALPSSRARWEGTCFGWGRFFAYIFPVKVMNENEHRLRVAWGVEGGGAALRCTAMGFTVHLRRAAWKLRIPCS